MKTVYKSGSVDKMITELSAELRNCTFVMYGADDKRFEEISKKLHQALPNVKKIGTTGFMFTEQGSQGEGIVVMGFTDEDAEVYVGSMRKLDTCPIKYLPGFQWSVETIHQKYRNNICIEFATGYEERVVSTMKVCVERVGMRILGGTPGNTTDGQAKKVACNGKVLTNAAVYAIIGSKMGKIEVFKENLYHTRRKIHTVTKVSEDNRTILELDGRKALDVYEEENHYTDGTVEKGIFVNPLCRIVGAEHYVTAIFSFDKSKRSIVTYKNVQKNDLISFTDIDEDYRKFMQDNMQEISNNHNIAGIFSVNCILRYLFFNDNHITNEYAKMMDKAANGCHLGVVGDGEQYVEQHINQSMVCAIFTKD